MAVPMNYGDRPAIIEGVKRGEETDRACADDGKPSGWSGWTAAQAMDGNSGRIGKHGRQGIKPARQMVDVGSRCHDLLCQAAGQVPADPSKIRAQIGVTGRATEAGATWDERIDGHCLAGLVDSDDLVAGTPWFGQVETIGS